MARGQNIISKVYNKPLLITMQDLQPIADYLSNPERVASLKMDTDTLNPPKLEDYDSEESYKKSLLAYLDVNPETMTGVLNIDGVLVNREGQMNSQCVELTSYQGLKKRFEMQVQQGIKSCVLMISSGGGEAFGAWSTANYVKKLAKQNNIKLTTYINGSACSAAYVWAVISDEIVSHPMGSSGSIGVLVQLYNDTKMLEKAGIQRSFVYAGGNKIPFDKEGNFTDNFISSLQKDIDNTYKKFVKHVSENRDMSEKEVIDTQASVFNADDALSLKLIDKIMELEDFEVFYGLKADSSYGSGVLLQTPDQNEHLQQEDIMSKEKDVTVDTQLSVEQLQEQLTNLNVEKEQLSTQVDTLTQQLVDFKSTKEQLQTLQANYDALLGEKEASDKAAKLATRKAAIEDAIGKDNEQVASLLSSTEQLEDTAFEIVVSSLSTQQELKQEKLKEKGNEGTQSPSQLSIEEKLAATAKKMTKQSA